VGFAVPYAGGSGSFRIQVSVTDRWGNTGSVDTTVQR
jgi:hypothetical protein